MRTAIQRALLIAAIVIFSLVGCAPTNVAVTSQYTGSLSSPQKILVYNFAVSADEVKLDPGVSAEVQAMMNKPQTPKVADELKVGRAAAEALANSLVTQIRKQGYPAERAYGVPTGAAGQVAIEGQLISVDEGNRAERVVVGLGAGRSDVKTMVQVYDLQPAGRKLLEGFTTDAKSGFKPGMAETEGASIVAGHWAAGLAVGAGLSVASEKYSANVEADADRTATQIALQLKSYFMTMGWYPTLPVQ